MFCQLEMLRHCLAPSIRDQLRELPKSLDETYERVLKEIQSTNQGRHARRLLHCLSVALRPLRIEDLAEVLAFEPNISKGGIPVFHPEWRWENQEQAVLSACSSLISIVDNNNTRVIQFSHFSVKEYLTSDRLAAASADVSQYHILPEPAHLMLAHACLGVLLRMDGRGERDYNNIPLLEYAAEHWPSHAQVGNVSSHLNYAMKILFDVNQPFFLAWIRIPSYTSTHDLRLLDDYSHWLSDLSMRRTQYIPMPLYYAALFGFYDLVRHLIIKHPEHVNHCSGNCHSPLVAALSGKHMLVAKLLVDHGAQIHIRGDSPLCHAIALPDDSARVDAVHFLFGHGADVNAGTIDLQTPLHTAAFVGCPEVARILLANGADVNLQDDKGRLPLHLVSISNPFGGKGEDSRYIVARLLVQHCSDVDAQSMNGETPLHIASYHGHLKICQLLLDHGANPHTEDIRGHNSLHKLLQGPHKEARFSRVQFRVQNDLSIAQLLLKHGVDTNSLDKHHETPFHMISYGLPIPQLLLDYGARVSAENALGQTPLHLLSRNYISFVRGANADIAWLLLEHGADVNAQDTNQETPLHFACSAGNLDITQFFLDHGADIDIQNANGQTPLHQTSEYYTIHSSSIALLLLERGADVNALSKDQKTPLHSACNKSRLEIVQMLLDYGAEVDAHDANGQTPLHQVSWFHDDEEDEYSPSDIAQLLLEDGADVDARDKNQETPLHSASRESNPRLTKVLLEHGANINAKNVRGQTPLHMVSDNKYSVSDSRAVRLFPTQGMDVNAEDRYQRSASHLWGSSTAQVLLENGAEANVVDIHGQNALHLLSQQPIAEVKIAELLLSWGVDMNAQDEEEMTPFHFAAYHGQVDVAELLLDYGARVDAENILGQTPLHLVLLGNQNYQNFYGDLDTFLKKQYPGRFAHLAQLLLECGADANAQNKDHETPLHLASRSRSHDLAQILLQYGADVNVKNSEGKSPLQLATGRKGKAMRRLLLAGNA